MLSTSVDLWYVSLSIGVLVLVGFISYVLYRLGNLILELKGTAKEVNHKLEMMDETVNLANDSLRMLNDSLRNVKELVDRLMVVVGDVEGEIRRVLSMFSSISGLLAGLSDALRLGKKKK
ncbi:DUF948 domain-containing protein [Patescibacteria group bacterium]|nr:DUF948 domain-containing protein [Patescibacteria group bacterium]